MKIRMAGLLLGMAMLTGAAAETPRPSAEAFMQIARRNVAQIGSRYVRMPGMVSHVIRGGGGAETAQLYFGLRFSPLEITAQLVLSPEERYWVVQPVTAVGGRTGAAVTREGGGAIPGERLERYGLRPAELTMDFLYWPVVREEDPVTCRTVPCRVFWNRSAQTGEWAKITASEEYFFPLKVEFCGSGETPLDRPERTLEISGFKQIGEYYVVTDLAVLAPDWRTRIRFENVEVGDNDPARPDAAFLKIPKGAE